MARLTFYEENAGRAFPLLDGDIGVLGGTGMIGVSNSAILDAGFVLGPNSVFDVANDSIYLSSIRRQSGIIYFTFRSTSPQMASQEILFSRSATDSGPTASFSDSGDLGEAPCLAPLWRGYLVTGDMPLLASLVAEGGQISGQARLEPALVQNRGQGAVTALQLANTDRTRVDAPDGCPPIVWPYSIGGVYPQDRCLRDDVRVRGGYGVTVRQSTRDNAIVFSASPGGGEGFPCDEVPLFASELPPDGSSLLEGGPRCNETVRSIGGAGGRVLEVRSGPGVVITGDAANHKVVIDVNFAGMSVRPFESASLSDSH